MFAVYSLLLAFIPIILLEISLKVLILACTQGGVHQGVIEAKFWAEKTWHVRYVFFNFALKSRSIMERFFNLFYFDASDNYRDANCRKKVHGVVCFGLSHQIFIEELLAAQQIETTLVESHICKSYVATLLILCPTMFKLRCAQQCLCIDYALCHIT